MTNMKLVAVVQRLLERTRSGRLNWDVTAVDDVYLTAVGELGIRVEKSDGPDGFAGGVIRKAMGSELPHYSIHVVNEDGRVLESIRSWSEGIPQQDVAELFDLARRQALGTDAAIDSLLQNL